MAQAVYATIPEPSEADEWNMLGQKIFPDWHGPGLAQYHSAGWTLQALVDYRCKADPGWSPPDEATVIQWAEEFAPSARPRQPSVVSTSSPFTEKRSRTASSLSVTSAPAEPDNHIHDSAGPTCSRGGDSGVAESRSTVANGNHDHGADLEDQGQVVPDLSHTGDDIGKGQSSAGHSQNETLDDLRDRHRLIAADELARSSDADRADALRRLQQKKRNAKKKQKQEHRVTGFGASELSTPVRPQFGEEHATVSARRLIPSQRVEAPPRPRRPPVDASTEFWIQIDGHGAKSGPRYFSKAYENHVQWARPQGNVVIIQSSMCRRGANKAKAGQLPKASWHVEGTNAPALLENPPGNLNFPS